MGDILLEENITSPPKPTKDSLPKVKFNGIKTSLKDIAEQINNTGSDILCRDEDELVNTIGHGVVDAISIDNAKKVFSYLETINRGERIMIGDRFIGWNIRAVPEEETSLSLK